MRRGVVVSLVAPPALMLALWAWLGRTTSELATYGGLTLTLADGLVLAVAFGLLASIDKTGRWSVIAFVALASVIGVTVGASVLLGESNPWWPIVAILTVLLVFGLTAYWMLAKWMADALEGRSR